MSLDHQLRDLNLESSSRDASDATVTPGQLIQQCSDLLGELNEYGEAIAANKTEKLINLSTFKNEVQTEIKSLQKLARSDRSSEKIQHHLKSCNLPYYQTLWSTTKRSSEVLKFRKWFYWDDNPSKPTAKKSKKGSEKRTKGAALVDLVSDNGEQWTKVSTITEQRLVFELAKQGWRNEETDGSDEELDEQASPIDDDEDEISLIRIAKNLAKAADANPCGTKRPQVRFVLPRLPTNIPQEIRKIIDDVRATGATVEHGREPADVPLGQVLPKLLINRFRGLSYVLNVDCTILLALVSDISHADVEPQPWFPKQATQQILEERKEHLLETLIYPAADNHPLVCTAEAAARMREIVGIIGTDTEKARTAILLNEDPSKSRERLLQEFQQLSVHPVPQGLQLPVHIASEPIDDSKLPPVARKVRPELSSLNQSVFFYGWAKGISTLSSNGAVSKQIEHLVVQHRASHEEEGPHIWYCGVPRSLIAKKGRGDVGDGEEFGL